MLRRLKCWWRGHHTYYPCYMQREYVGSYGSANVPVKEFQYKCETCNTKTEWTRVSKQEQWESENNPCWGNEP